MSANARNEGEYSETAEAMVKLFHPDRFASDPIQQVTYEKLTAVINQAKENGDFPTLRKIADDP